MGLRFERGDRCGTPFSQILCGVPLRRSCRHLRPSCRFSHLALQVAEPGLGQREDIFACGLGPEMNVGVRLEQYDAIRILDQQHQNIGILAAEVQMHDAFFGEQRIVIPVDPCPVMCLRDTIPTLDAFDYFIKLTPQGRAFADASEVLEFDDVNLLGFALDAT